MAKGHYWLLSFLNDRPLWHFEWIVIILRFHISRPSTFSNPSTLDLTHVLVSFTINLFQFFRLASCLKQVTNVSNWKLLSTMSMIICIHFHNLNMNYPYQENVRNGHFRSKISKMLKFGHFGPKITISNIEKKIFQLRNDLIYHR